MPQGIGQPLPGPTREWVASELATILRLRPEEIDDCILSNVLSYETPDELAEFLKAFFVGGEEEEDAAAVRRFAEQLLARRERSPRRRRRGGRFAPLSAEGSRRFCLCNAQHGEHWLVGNCLACGKVVCSAEGEGPCLFCGSPVTPRQRAAEPGHILAAALLAGDREKTPAATDEPQEMKPEKNEEPDFSLQAALQQKDRLLQFQKEAVERTKVYDDATDWFSEVQNPWLTAAERQEARRIAEETQQRRKDRRKKLYLTFDFKSEEVARVERALGTPEDENIFARAKNGPSRENLPAKGEGVSAGGLLSGEAAELYATLQRRLQLAVTVTDVERKQLEKQSVWEERPSAAAEEAPVLSLPPASPAHIDGRLRWQSSAQNVDAIVLPAADDDEEMENDNDDEGICLSVRQPFASLLVHGFKRTEERDWNTSYRGRLWIHAASKQVDPEEIERCKVLYNGGESSEPEQRQPEEKNGRRPSFPVKYPTSALLGCVDLVDCIISQMAGDYKLWRLPREKLPHFQRGLQEPKNDHVISTDSKPASTSSSFSPLRADLSEATLRALHGLFCSFSDEAGLTVRRPQQTPLSFRIGRSSLLLTIGKGVLSQLLLQQFLIMNAARVSKASDAVPWFLLPPSGDAVSPERGGKNAFGVVSEEEQGLCWATGCPAEAVPDITRFYNQVVNSVLEPRGDHPHTILPSPAKFCSCIFVSAGLEQPPLKINLHPIAWCNEPPASQTVVMCIGDALRFHDDDTLFTLDSGDVLALHDNVANPLAAVVKSPTGGKS